MNKLVEALKAKMEDEYPFSIRMTKEIIDQLDGRHGWKLVPVEPTEEMDTASNISFPCVCGRKLKACGTATWDWTLAASPDPLEDKP